MHDVVTTTEFQNMMYANPTVLTNIKAAVSPFSSDASFMNELTTIWFNVTGFNRVFVIFLNKE